ncbi:3D domain-containing protein [bacterium]|nr:3D domain-containing protein [bacterium]
MGISLSNSDENQAICIFYNPIKIKLPENNEVSGISCFTDKYDILEDFGYSREHFEILTDVTSEGARILTAVPVERTRRLTWQKIDHDSVITYVKDLPHRKKVYEKGGRYGLQGKVVEEIRFSSGKSNFYTIDRWIEKEPVTEYLRIGTKYDLKTIEIDGEKVHYWRKLTVLATSYDHTCSGCNKTTATGAYLTKGIVAVDPRIIPLHTNMYIPGYGFGKAEDTGGKIKGNRIDLAFDDIRYGNWSRRLVTIYIID